MSAQANSAFPQQAQHAMNAQLGFVTKQNEMVPGWYAMAPHPDENVVVTQDGVPLLPQFTVAQVAYGRRWCIGMDGGLMSQIDFKIKLEEVRHEFYALLRSQGRNAQFHGKMDRGSTPTVKKFASKKVDPENEAKLMDVHYDPYAKAGAEMDHFVDGQGEKVEGGRLQILVEAYHSEKLRPALTKREVAQVEAHLGTSVGAGGNGLAGKLEQLNDLLADGSITPEVHSQKVAALTGAPAPTAEPAVAAAPKPKVRRAAPRTKAPCGESIFNFHKKRHAGSCVKPECAALRKASD